MRVDISNLRVRLGGTEVLRGVSTTVDSGTLVGLVGPNGAGKTTLLRAVNSGLTPDAGTVRVGGESVHDLPSKAASRRVATVPQDTHVSFDFTVRQVVEMGRYPHVPRFGTDPDPGRVTDALERTDTAQFADRPVGEVSGGERQRVLLARALAQDAPVLLLDEPTASLDVTHQVRTLDLVRNLADDGRTVVAAVHDLTLAARYCDELVLLADGEVAAHGPPADVLTDDALRGAFGGGAVVARHPLTGTPLVTARSVGGDRDARVHVVGGGAAELLADLDAAGFAVTVGPVAEDSVDYEAARALGVEAVAVPPFEPVDGTALERTRDLIERADATVVAPGPVTPGNVPALRAAATADNPVAVRGRPFAERNRAGDDGRRVHDHLESRAATVDPGDLLEAVGAACAADPAPPAEDPHPRPGD